MTSGESRAKEGRYAFIETIEAPNPTLAPIARRAENHHMVEVEGSRRNNDAASEPKAEKNRRVRFRCEG
jgi:hypothetical protein